MGCEEIGSEQDGLEIETSIEKRRWIPKSESSCSKRTEFYGQTQES
jgi:hypothetical protein